MGAVKFYNALLPLWTPVAFLPQINKNLSLMRILFKESEDVSVFHGNGSETSRKKENTTYYKPYHRKA